MSEVVIVEAVRTPIGRRGGGLSTMHSADLLAEALKALIDRSGIDPAEVEQVIGGCVSQVGMQAFNIARTAWLTAGLPLSAPATTVDSQCGSSQQATNFATSLVSSGVVDVAVACGVEVMSQVPMGSSLGRGLGVGKAKTEVGLTVRVIDATTGEILVSAKGLGVSKKGGGFAFAKGGTSFGTGSSDFRESAIGEAQEMACAELVKQLVARRDNLQ